MQNHFMNHKLSMILTLCFFLSLSLTSNAQMRSRTASDSVLAQLNKVWYNSSKYQFQVQYPVLQVIPPLSTGMDDTTLIAYIYLDSLMRSNIPSGLFNYQAWLHQKTKNDTINGMIKYLYKLIDYDPIRFYQYMHSQSTTVYKTYLIGLLGKTHSLLANIELNTPNEFVMEDLNAADYLLNVQVNSVQSLPSIYHPNEYVYQVNATVLDTLKGKVFQQCNNNQNLINKKPGEKPLTNGSTICFTYFTGPYSNDFTNRKIHPTLKDSTGNLTIHPGQQLIITLSHEDYLWDYNYDYFDLTLLTAIPVINGQVIDLNQEWSNSTTLNYSDWKNAFLQKRDLLLNGGY